MTDPLKDRVDKAAVWAEERLKAIERIQAKSKAFHEEMEAEHKDIDSCQPKITIGEIDFISTAEGNCWPEPFSAKYAFSREDALRLRDWLTDTFE